MTGRPEVGMFVFEDCLDSDSSFYLWGIRDPSRIAQMIASFAGLCAAARRTREFTMHIEIPGDESTIWFTRAQIGRILYHSSGGVHFGHGEFARMKGERGRISGTLTFSVTRK